MTSSSSRALATPTWSALLSMCVSGLVGIWFPVAFLGQLDALLAFMTTREILRDAALTVSVLFGVAVALASLARLVAVALRRHVKAASCSAWLLCAGPVVGLCALQLIFVGEGVVRGVAPPGYLKYILAGLLVVACLRHGIAACLAFVIESIASLRYLASCMVLVSFAIIAMHWHDFTSQGSSYTPLASGASRPPDIYLITFDALSEDIAQTCEGQLSAMKALADLAKQATCFKRFYAGSNFTTPTTSTIETGALPWRHWAVQIGAKIALPLRADSLSVKLQQAGYETVSISANLLASPKYHGTTQGYDFAKISESTSLRTALRDRLTIFSDSSLPIIFYAFRGALWKFDVLLNRDRYPYPPESVFRVAEERLLTARKPAFYWLHLLPPHAPYLPPPATKYTLLPPGELDKWSDFLPDTYHFDAGQAKLIDKHKKRYVESIAGADASLKRFLDFLKQHNKYDDAVIIVSADHGESFDHGYLGHAGPQLHEGLIKIPLVVKLAHQSSGTVNQIPTSQADLTPTILDIAGVTIPPRWSEGVSVRPLLTGQSFSHPPVYAMEFERQSRFKPISSGHVAMLEGDFKGIYDIPERKLRLFDLSRDPGETHDISGNNTVQAMRMMASVEAKLKEANALRKNWFEN